MHLILNGCQPSCQTNYFKTIVSFGIDATAQVMSLSIWHIQLKQLWIGVLRAYCALSNLISQQRTTLENSVPTGSTVRWFEHVAPSQGFLRVFHPVAFYSQWQAPPSPGSVWVHNAKKAYGSKFDGSCDNPDSWLELRVAGWAGLWAVGAAARYDHHYWLADVSFHTTSYYMMGWTHLYYYIGKRNFKQAPGT